VEEDQNLAPLLFSMSTSTGSGPVSIPTARDPVVPTLSSPKLAAEDQRWRWYSPAMSLPLRIPQNHLPRKPSRESLPAISGPIMPNGLSPENEMALVGGIKIQCPPQTSGPRMYGHHQGQQQQGQVYPFECDECPRSFHLNANVKRHKQMHLMTKHQSTGRLFDHSVALLLSRSQ
jgi:hypothetical protein